MCYDVEYQCVQTIRVASFMLLGSAVLPAGAGAVGVIGRHDGL
jgi:hypothetical protein